MNSDRVQPWSCTTPSRICAAVCPPLRAGPHHGTGLISNLKFETSNPLPLLLEPAFFAFVCFCKVFCSWLCHPKCPRPPLPILPPPNPEAPSPKPELSSPKAELASPNPELSAPNVGISALFPAPYRLPAPTRNSLNQRNLHATKPHLPRLATASVTPKCADRADGKKVSRTQEQPATRTIHSSPERAANLSLAVLHGLPIPLRLSAPFSARASTARLRHFAALPPGTTSLTCD